MGEEGLKDKMNDFDGFQVNMELIENADENWAFMHCLPAHRGDEVTDDVMDHANSIVFRPSGEQNVGTNESSSVPCGQRSLGCNGRNDGRRHLSQRTLTCTAKAKKSQQHTKSNILLCFVIISQK